MIVRCPHPYGSVEYLAWYASAPPVSREEVLCALARWKRPPTIALLVITIGRQGPQVAELVDEMVAAGELVRSWDEGRDARVYGAGAVAVEEQQLELTEAG